jgi:murein DD-endopeptidase MepM/ murein hydrolase activator NlpD
MEKLFGIVIALAAIVYFLDLKECAKRSETTRRIVVEGSRQETKNQTAQPIGQINVSAIDATKDVAEKIAAAAPDVLGALKECPEEIDPAQITSHWGNESDFCPGEPIRLCPVSIIKRDGKVVMDPKTGKPIDGAHGPMGLMRSTWETWGKPGESPEVLADAMKMAVRHLCFAKKKDGTKPSASSDDAILRYNASRRYLNDIRAMQAKHGPIWAAIRSGKGTVLARAAVSNGVQTAATSDNKGQLVISKPYGVATPLESNKGTVCSILGEERSGGKRSHGGLDICTNLQPPTAVYAIADGTIIRSGWHHDGNGPGERAGIQIQLETNASTKAEGSLAGAGYSHLESVVVEKGARVTRGQLLGYIGRTAVNDPRTPTHLHFQTRVWHNGQADNCDPFDFIDFGTLTPGTTFYAGPASPEQARQYAAKFVRVSAAVN